MANLTLVYYANGGDSTPADDNQPYTGNPVTFTLADAITKDSPTGKYRFVGWEINGTVYEAKEQVSLDKNYLATAIFAINDTTVSTKDYGYSPNGTKNALGTTRYHHQPSYPHAMGVGARRTTKPTVPPTPTPPTPTQVQIQANHSMSEGQVDTVTYSVNGGDFQTLGWGSSTENLYVGDTVKFKFDAGTGYKIQKIMSASNLTVYWSHWPDDHAAVKEYEVEFETTADDVNSGFHVFYIQES